MLLVIMLSCYFSTQLTKILSSSWNSISDGQLHWSAFILQRDQSALASATRCCPLSYNCWWAFDFKLPLLFFFKFLFSLVMFWYVVTCNIFLWSINLGTASPPPPARRPSATRITFQQQQMSLVMASRSNAGGGGFLSLRSPKICVNNDPTSNSLYLCTPSSS